MAVTRQKTLPGSLSFHFVLSCVRDFLVSLVGSFLLLKMTGYTVFGVLAVIVLGVSGINAESSVVTAATANAVLPSSAVTSHSVPVSRNVAPTASSVSLSNNVASSSRNVAPASSSVSLPNNVASSSRNVAPASSSVSGIAAHSSNVVPSTSVSITRTVKSTMVQSTSVSTKSESTPLLSSVKASASTKMIHTSSPVQPTSTAAARLVTPSPTAVMAPESIDIKDKNNVSCLMASIEVDFKIIYTTKNGTSEANTTIPLNGDDKTRKVDGNCSFTSGEANFEIMWNEHGDLSKPRHTFGMYFNLNETSKKWNVTKIMAIFQTKFDTRFKNASEDNITAIGDSELFKSTNSSTFICNSKTKIYLSNNVTAKFQDVTLQPFSHKTKLAKDGSHCAADKGEDEDDEDNTVPIAVGAALGGLVLIVLVAYIIGRRRSNRGYEQV